MNVLKNKGKWLTVLMINLYHSMCRAKKLMSRALRLRKCHIGNDHIANGRQGEIADNESEVILSTYLTSKADPQTGVHVCTDDFAYMEPLYSSAVRHNLRLIIFHDHLSSKFVETHSRPNIRFTRCDHSRLSVNDVRYLIYRDFLHGSSVQSAFMVDVADVTITKNPFPIIESGVLYVGRDQYKTVGTSRYMLRAWQKWNQEGGSRLPWGMQFMPLYNAGVIGGKRDVVIALLDCMCSLYRNVDSDYDFSMLVFNCAVYKLHKPRLSIVPAVNVLVDPDRDKKSSLPTVMTGFPLNSPYKRYCTNSNAYFIHK